MTHEFDRAEVRRDERGVWLCLRVKNPWMARKQIGLMEAGKWFIAEIKRKIERRSSKANRYFWKLCGMLAAVSGVRKEDIYRSYIIEIGDNSRFVPYIDEAQRKLIWTLWESQGLGWVVEDAGQNLLCCYYGSSTYDTRQMGRLIDLVVQDCKDQDIETAPPGDILRWVNDWRPEARTV